MEEEPSGGEVDGVGPRPAKLGKIGVAKSSRQRQRVTAGVLDCRRVEMCHVVEGRVVRQHIVDEREVETGVAIPLEYAQVGVVGQALVDLVSERGRDRVGSGGGELADQCAIAIAGLEHEVRTARPAGLEVQHYVDVFAPRMRPRECIRAGHARLFHVEEKDDVILERSACLQHACRLQQYADRVSIVGGSRPRTDRVIVAAQQHRPTVAGAFQSRHDVFRPPGEHERIALIESRTLLNFRGDSQNRQLGQDVIARRGRFGRARRMRFRRDGAHVLHRSVGGKLRRRRGESRRMGQGNPQAPPGARGKNGGSRGPLDHAG